MAEILPFPYARRRGFIRKQAAFLGAIREDVAEKHLRQQLKVQRETMERRGIDPDRIATELRTAELILRMHASLPVQEGGAA